MKSLRHVLLLLAALISCFVFAFNSLAIGKDKFPTGPITLLIGFPPGGPLDIQSRCLAEILGKYFGQRVVVVNKDGLNAGVMLTDLSRQKPDGYTIGLAGGGGLAFNHLVSKVEYNYKDFTYILGVSRHLQGVSVLKDAPWKTFDEFIEYSKKNPGKIRYGSFSSISNTSFLMRLIAKQKQIDWIHVPYKGDGPAITAILGKHLDALATAAGQAPYVRSGNLRLLALFNTKRFEEFPDVPTIYELGYKVPYLADMHTLHGVVAPKGLTGEPFETLVSAFKKAVQEPAYTKVRHELCLGLEILEPKEFEKEIAESYEEFGRLYPPLLKEVQK